jgi:pyruvate kinase
MLSAESAAGQYPVEAVTTMNNVACEVESDPTYRDVIKASRGAEKESVADAIVSAAREIAETTDVAAIGCFTESGTTGSLVARERPQVPILLLTSKNRTARRMALTWGAHCVVTDEVNRFKEAVVRAVRAALKDDFATKTDQIVVTAGVPFNQAGTTNIVRVAPCDERLIYRAEPE